jgi:hypothetical protein
MSRHTVSVSRLANLLASGDRRRSTNRFTALLRSDDALARLARAELIFRRGTPPDTEHAFKHRFFGMRRTILCCTAHGSNFMPGSSNARYASQQT